MRAQSRHLRQLLVASLFIGVIAESASAQNWGVSPRPTFAQTIQQVVAMPQNQNLQRMAQQHGLNVVNVMWEDTGRFQGSSVGPNISDLTLQVRENLPNGQMRTHLLPVIRHPNFSDRTADIRARKLWVRVGNQRNGRTHAVPLSEVLGNLRAYLSDPGSLLGDGDFTAERDTHYLVSAQHVFVPIQAQGQAEFNPVIYNYQSSEGNPAVLTLLVTRQGTSAAVIENRAGDQSLQGWGQQLFFNNHGQRTVFTAERRSAVEQRIQNGQATGQDTGALEEGADMMMIVQIPLRHRRARFEEMDMPMAMAESAGAPAPTRRRSAGGGGSDVEQAVIGHGDDLGPYREMGRMRLVRDDRFPVRVTVQFYRATSNGVISAQDMQDVRRSIDRVYEDGDFVGSLVVPQTDHTRPTQWRRIRHRWMNQWRRQTRRAPQPTPETAAAIAVPSPVSTLPSFSLLQGLAYLFSSAE